MSAIRSRLHGTAGRVGHVHNSVFGAVERWTADWLPGLLARFAFAAVLFAYYLNSAQTKVGDGLLGFFQLRPGAYIQILGFPALDAAGGDPAALGQIDKLTVFAGTYAEFVLPVLIVIGLFSRLAALGMIGFIAVQSYVDVTLHGLDEKSVGAWFDRFPDSVVMDQRLLWVVPLAFVVLRGPGLVSVDRLLGSLTAGDRRAVPPEPYALTPAE